MARFWTIAVRDFWGPPPKPSKLLGTGTSNIAHEMLFSAAILATAAAVAPPRIELDLSAMNNAYKLASSVVRSHDLGYQQTNGAAVMSRQDWTEKCPAATDGSTNPTTCPFPSAAAYDHQDSVVDVTTRVKLVDEGGSAMDVDVNQVNFAKRSTYLFRYDAHDGDFFWSGKIVNNEPLNCLLC